MTIKKKILSLVLSLFSLSTATFATTNQHIAYTEVGHGQPLVLIHAFPTDQRLWKPQQEGLKNNFRVITLDLWGFGQSAPTDGKTITMTGYADEVNQLLQQLHIQKAIIAGESMGGYVALAFLAKYPDEVQGLVLSNTQAIADNAEKKAKREKVATDVLKDGNEKLIEQFMSTALSSHASEQTKDYLREILDAQKATGIASAARGLAAREDTSEVLSQTKVPVLIITSETDALVPSEQSQAMHALAKNSKLVMLNGAGHLSNLEQAEAWNRAVMGMFAPAGL